MTNISLELVFEIPKIFNAGLSDLDSQLDLTTFKPQTEKVAEDS